MFVPFVGAGHDSLTTQADLNTLREPYHRYGVCHDGIHAAGAWQISEVVLNSWEDIMTGITMVPGALAASEVEVADGCC